MTNKLYLHVDLDDHLLDQLKDALPENCVLIGMNDPRNYESFAKCDMVFGNVPLEWVLASTTLRWIQLQSTGTDPYIDRLSEIKDRGITLTNLYDFFGHAVSETALAGILALKRGIDRLVLLKNEACWLGSALRPSLSLLHESKAIILGAGSIGQATKKLLVTFGTEVLLYDINPSIADISTLEELDRKIPLADLVVTCLPDNTQTRNLFDENRLSLLSAKSIYVNVGRASVVDEAALIRFLHQKRIAGAVLDVTSLEPLPGDHDLWKCPNVILTQHSGGGWNGEMKQKVAYFLDNLQRYLRGDALSGTVT